MTERNLGIVDVLEALETKLAYVPGGRDREGKPILIVNIPTESQDNLIATSRLEKLLSYLLSIFNDASKQNGICLIIDARKGSWREARSYIRRTINVVGKYAARTIVIRPDGFWEKRVDNCTKSWKDGEPTYVPITRLSSYVDVAQITCDFGGIKYYDHAEWIQIRLRVEEYERDATDLINKLIDLRNKLCDYDKMKAKKEQEKALEYYWETREDLELVGRYILHSGRVLASNMSIETSQDFQDTVNKIHDLLDILELKQTEVEDIWSHMTTNLNLAKEISDLEEGVTEVTNWILGPADAMLNFHCNVGFDVASSENLRREHEELELECRETYGRYAKLLHRIESIPEGCLTEDLKSQKDFMDFVCRSFATRLERRRNVLITCQRFFRLVSEYFDKTSEAFDKLIMGDRNCNFSEAEEKLKHLESSQLDLDKLLKELIKEGEKLSDILSMPVKDALGRDLDINYGEDIANVRDILDATNARKNIFNDSVELQKLTLKQTILIFTYETDAEQTIKWLTDLFKVLIVNHIDIGCNANEIHNQREELQTFQETAQGTFDYGCQLLNGARVLRISCRLSLDSNTGLFSQLRQAWRRHCSVTQEQLTRLRVCTVFHRSVDEHCCALTDLIKTVKIRILKPKDAKGSDESCSENQSVGSRTDLLREILENREKLLVNVGRTVRLGRLLRTRLKEPLYSQLRMSSLDEYKSASEPRNLSAIDAISDRLAEVTRLAEKLDARLYEAGARTRIPKSHDEEDGTSGVYSKPKKLETASRITTTTTVPIGLTSTSTDKKTSVNVNFDKETNVIKEKGIERRKETENENEKDAGSMKEVLSETEDGYTEEYATATECSETPMARSRSESFVTMSEYEETTCSDIRRMDGETREVADAIEPTAASVEELQKTKISSVDLVSSGASEKRVHHPQQPEIIMSKTADVIVDINQNVDVKSNATAIIESVEEKSGKIVKEVTEVTTLRVSHDTKFGVASYKLTSNTLTENREVKNAEGILDASHQSSVVTGYGNDAQQIDKKDNIHDYSREEINISEVNENNYLNSEINQNGDDLCNSRISKIVKESCDCQSRKYLMNNGKQLVSFLETKGNDDSGIEMTPRRGDGRITGMNHDDDEDEDDVDEEEQGFFDKLKTVSCTQVAAEM